MTPPVTEAKRREAEMARDRLLTTAHEIQARLKVGAIADRALDHVRETSERAADGALAAARRRPVAVVAAASGLAALIVAGPIVRLVRRMRTRD